MIKYRIDAEKFTNLPNRIKVDFIRTIKEYSATSGFDLDFRYLWFTITEENLLLLTLQTPEILTYFRRKK